METKLTAERRNDTGKGVARKLRAAGRIPAVFYGHDQESIALSVDAREMRHALRTDAGANVLIDLMVEGTAHLALPRQIQQNHIKDTIVHVDFMAVSRTEKITAMVEIIDIGDAPGVKQGGVVDHHLREVEIESFPQDVPSHLEADISALDIGDSIHVSDLVAPKGVTILTSPEDTVLAVITPAALRTEAELTLPGEEAPEVEVPVAEGEEPEAVEGAVPAAEEGGES
jgi:large subunit ribosomal protein L25